MLTNSISIHTTRVGGDKKKLLAVPQARISIHTTRVGGDLINCLNMFYCVDFNPHHPCGWWLSDFANLRTQKNFNPHHPCGWWPIFRLEDGCNLSNFNPHHPCGWWHTDKMMMSSLHFISIHTTRVGGDSGMRSSWLTEKLFQSTPPVWVVTLHNGINW